MNRRKAVTIAVLTMALLTLMTGVAIAVWEDTKGTRVTANVLPLPGGTFRFSSPGSCRDAVVGYEAHCGINVTNESSTIMVVTAMTVTTTYPDIAIRVVTAGCLNVPIDPGRAHSLNWYYTPSPSAMPGEVAFDIEVTCLGE